MNALAVLLTALLGLSLILNLLQLLHRRRIKRELQEAYHKLQDYSAMVDEIAARRAAEKKGRAGTSSPLPE